MKQAGLLGGATLLLAALLVYPAWLLGGALYVIQCLTAMGLCLLPALGTLLWIGASAKASPEMKIMAALGSSGIRMAVVLGIGLLLYWKAGEIYTDAFWVWLLVFYFFTLALELILIVGQPVSSAR